MNPRSESTIQHKQLDGISNLRFDREEKTPNFQILNLEVCVLEEVTEEGHVSLKLLEFQSIWMLRELDGNAQGQFVFIALLGFLVFDGLGL